MKKAMTLIASLIGALAGSSLPSSVHAANAVSFNVGTTGLGLHLSTPVHDAVNLRVGVNYYNRYRFDTRTEFIHYDLNLKVKTFDALVDWFPMRNPFRLTGGLIYNNNRIDGIGLPRDIGEFRVQGRTFTVAQLGQINGKIDFRSTAPYLGIGWGNAVSEAPGWGFTGDVGVMFQGKPRVSLGTSGCSLPGLSCNVLNIALAPVIRQEAARLNEELKQYRYLPVIRLGVSYRF